MIERFGNDEPRLGQRVFLAPNASLIGRVVIGEDSSVWHGAVLRGDVAAIEVGARTNIQDLTVIHGTTGQFDTFVGDDVTVGHRVILHGCRVGDHVLVGMGAILLDGVEVGPYSVIGAGSVVTPGTKIPGGVLALGSPCRVVRPLRDEERAHIDYAAAHYLEVVAEYRKGAL